MNPPAEDIKDYIVAETSYVFGEDLFIGTQPDKPDQCLTLYDSPGLDTDDKFAIEKVGIQFRSRAQSYQLAYSICHDMKLLLEGLKEDVVLNGSRYFGFYVTSQPTDLGRDAEDQHMFTMTMQISRNPENAGNRS